MATTAIAVSTAVTSTAAAMYPAHVPDTDCLAARCGSDTE